MEGADRVVDIIVVGTGAAGAVAAIEAADRGSRVLMVEKAAVFGGTTRRSAGAFWIPGNPLMRQQDPKEDCLKFMARASYPGRYNPDLPRLGLGESDYRLLEAFYDRAPEMAVSMTTKARLRLARPDIRAGRSDYYPFAENKVPRGRSLKPVGTDGEIGRGDELARQLEQAVAGLNIPVLKSTGARRIVRNRGSEVLGIEGVDRVTGKPVSLTARKAVIFATGGFAHNGELRRRLLPEPIFGSCAVPEAQGDFVYMAQEIGAAVAQRARGWWAEIVLEEALDGELSDDVWVPPGDSMILVNKHGGRVVNEKLPYHLRTPVHFHRDAAQQDYPNLLLFMVYDRKSVESFHQATTLNYPVLDPERAYVITGATLEELGAGIGRRLRSIEEKGFSAAVRLAPDFVPRLRETMLTFNAYAREGRDREFHRGESPVESDMFHAQAGRYQGRGWPNVTMAPIATSGPYYSIILAAGTLDTHGGPKINEKAQILDRAAKPIPRLYGAGNCVEGPAGEAYWGPGATLGLAMTFGYIAGRNAAAEKSRDDRTPKGGDN